MVTTPWGDASTLRERRLPPGPGTPREKVIENQRERLFAAMVAVASTKGYAQTSVADLSRLSGVSRRTFYDLFADREACFLAALDAVLDPTEAITVAQMAKAGSWEERAAGTVGVFLNMVVAQPAAARLCFVESYAVGAAATARVDEAMVVFEELLKAAFEEQPERMGMPDEMARAMIGGIRKMVHTRLHRGTEAELLDMLPGLVELGLSFRPPSEQLRGAPKRRRRNGKARVESGGEERIGLGWTEEDPAERLIRATMVAMAAEGYQATTVGDIVEAAGSSLSTFYEHFSSKEDVFEATLYSGRARMMGVLLPTLQRARNWPEGIRAVTSATLDFLAAEPEFTRLITIEVYAAGDEALERRDRGLEGTMATLEGGLRYNPDISAAQLETMIEHPLRDGRPSGAGRRREEPAGDCTARHLHRALTLHRRQGGHRDHQRRSLGREVAPSPLSPAHIWRRRAHNECVGFAPSRPSSPEISLGRSALLRAAASSVLAALGPTLARRGRGRVGIANCNRDLRKGQHGKGTSMTLAALVALAALLTAAIADHRLDGQFLPVLGRESGGRLLLLLADVFGVFEQAVLRAALQGQVEPGDRSVGDCFEGVADPLRLVGVDFPFEQHPDLPVEFGDQGGSL